jgi:hypothetical protein
MQAIFFPFTFISKAAAKALHSLLGRIIVYSPSKLIGTALVNDAELVNLINRRIPVAGDEDLVKRIIRDFKAWGDIKRDGGMDMSKFTGMSIPFFDENSINQIKTDIKKGLSAPAEMQENPLLQARIFLHLAHEFDQHNNDVNQELLLCEELERKLINDLTGTDGDTFNQNKPRKVLIDTSDNFKTGTRISAWTRIFLHDQEKSAPVFITTSSDTIEYLKDKDERLEKIFTIRADAQENDELSDQIDALANSPWDPAATLISSLKDSDIHEREIPNSLTLYIRPDKTPHEFFAGCAGIDLSEKKQTTRNTILGLVQTPVNQALIKSRR